MRQLSGAKSRSNRQADDSSGATTLECDVRFPVFAGEIPHCGRQFSLDGPLAFPVSREFMHQPETRPSLILRLKGERNELAWTEFASTYESFLRQLVSRQ